MIEIIKECMSLKNGKFKRKEKEMFLNSDF
jgi:hypothetical protein